MLVSVEKTFFDKECKFEIIQAKEVQAREEKKDIKKTPSKGAVINNRVNHPDYWKTLKQREEAGFVGAQ